MLLNNNTNGNYTMRQLKLPLEIEKLIDISDPVYTFCEVMDHIDLSRYFVEKGYKTGRPRCDAQKLLKTSVYKGYKQDKIEMRGDRAEMSDFPLYLNTVAGGLDRRDQTIGGFSFVVKIYAVPVVEIIG